MPKRTASQKNTKKVIKNLIIIGDSLSDRGVMYGATRIGSKLLSLLGLLNKSPFNRFTNGYAWTDHLAANLANKFTVKDLVKKTSHDTKKTNSTDIADGIITHDKKIRKQVDRYTLNDPLQIRYQNQEFIRSYCEGGLSNHQYPFSFFQLGYHTATRLVVPYLSNKLSEIKKDDQDRIQQNKQETLTILWSGTNDLGLVNDSNEKEYTGKVHSAIDSLGKSIEELIQSGYCYFLLLNIPDPAQAPGFKETKPLIEASQYYNKKLWQLRQNLHEQYPHCHFDLFDINLHLQKIVNHPEAYYLDKSKIKDGYLTSSDFKPIKKSGDLQPASGYLFWDTVHPTTHVHSIIARKVEKMIRTKYVIEPPTMPTELKEVPRSIKGFF